LSIELEDTSYQFRFTSSKINEQMDKILNSPEFRSTEAQRSLLKYVVKKSLAGRGDEIKGYALATEVFGRGEDFDQSIDPVVSIHANKLRRALERYYLVAGQTDSIRIDIPKGTYVPIFMEQSCPVPTSVQKNQSVQERHEMAWPGLVVQNFANFTGDSKLAYVGIAIATEIAVEITRYQEIRVLLQRQEINKQRASDSGARFALTGSLFQGQSHLKVNIVLTDLNKGCQVWADTHRTEINPARLMSFIEAVSRAVAGKICAENGIISKQLSLESKVKPISKLTSYEAVLRYHRFNAQYTRQSFEDAMACLVHASEAEPECGLVWSMIARLYAVNYSMELFNRNTPIDKAIEFAQTGVKLDPSSQRSRIILAFALMLANKLSSARIEVKNALALNPESIIFLDNIGYLSTLLGEWQQGTALIQKAIHINPYYDHVVHCTLWLDLFRQGNYGQAHVESLSFRAPNLFWYHLATAATLGHLGRIPEARKSAAALLRLKPDFSQSGRRLIGHYVKFENIVEPLIEGLGRAEIDIT
jgi:adenylate cyclase